VFFQEDSVFLCNYLLDFIYFEERGASGKLQASSDQLQAAGNEVQGTGSREQGTGNREQGTGKILLQELPTANCLLPTFS
jgi:hypothetical protein